MKRAQIADLRISETLALPIDSVTEAFAMIGRRGAGKTNAAVVLVEEMIEAGVPTITIDPTGAWWGLRSSADGKGDGLPVVIFGGEHADVPLTEAAGEVIADAIVAGRFPAIIDLSDFSKSAMRRFMADFAERLYRRNREPLHLVIDEADVLAPQRLDAAGMRVFGAIDDIVRRGHIRGLGVTLITQRPAVLNKDLLSQVEVLIALQLTGARDVGAIDEWIRLNATDDEAKIVKASLAALPTGTGWVWSPSLLGILEKTQIRRRRTFDSSATPKPGQPRPVAEAFAAVDTAALGAQIASLAEQAKSADPKALRARVARLEKEVEVERALREQAEERAPAPPAEPEIRIERVEVPMLSAEDQTILTDLMERGYAIERQVETWRHALAGLRTMLEAQESTAAATAAPSASPSAAASRPVRPSSPPVTLARSRVARASEGNDPGAATKPTKAERAILSVLAQQPERTATQVALLTGYSHKSGGFRNALSSLRSAGRITGSGATGMNITTEGITALGDYEPLPTGDALLDWWKERHLGKAERAIVDVLRDHYPRPVPVVEIAERTGYAATSGGYRNSLSRLRTLQVVRNDSPGVLALAPEMVG